MAAIPLPPININGHIWYDVTNETTAGDVYSARDVIACGGKRPWIVSSVSCNSRNDLPKNKKEKPNIIPKQHRQNKRCDGFKNY